VPALSIVIPTLGRSAALPSVLRSLERQHPRLAGVEVLVVLDALAPSTAQPASRSLDLSVLRAARPGASAARNAGWQAARAPLVLFLDDDVVPTRKLVSRHLEDHRRMPEPELGVLGRLRWSPKVRVTPFMRWLEQGIAFNFGEIDGTRAGWGHFYSANASLKRELLERVGGFDEICFPYGYEDLELARRLSEHGLRLHYDRHAVGEHLKTETLEGWRRNLRRIAISERRFVERYPDVRPYFYELFQAAALRPVASGRSARLAGLVPPAMPLLGPLVWRSFDIVSRQQLATEFLREWELAQRAEPEASSRP
jgi:glycosyltransferase involved in cell wall biosynthesis